MASVAQFLDDEWLPTGAEWECSVPKLPTLEEVRTVLTDRTREPPIEELYKSIFCLRQQAEVASQAVEAIIQSLSTFPPMVGSDLRNTSVLFRHECCYLLGQIGADSSDVDAVKKPVFLALLSVLEDEREDEVTRHEAAEGIAAVFNHNLDEENFDYEAFDQQLMAFSSKYSASEDANMDDERDFAAFKENARTTISASLPSSEGDKADHQTRRFLRRNRRLMGVLNSYVTNKPNSPLGETCYVALQGLKRQRSRVCACQYRSFDPAIGDPSATAADIQRYADILADEGQELYQRYIAMFTLRNLNASRPLAHVLSTDSCSAALRHEIAFILGQMEFTSETSGEGGAGTNDAESAQEASAAEENVAVTALIENLRSRQEHAMVRHEAAIALGSIGGDLAKAALRELVADSEQMVAESCLVALDTCAYWEAWEDAERRINGD